MKKALWLLILASGPAFAESNDTYNFYFQKAPGPATVNQGVAGATTGTPDLKIQGDQVTPAAGASAAAAPAPAAEKSDFADLEIRMGYFDGVLGPDREDLYDGQLNLGLQVNVSRQFGFAFDTFYLTRTSTNYYENPMLAPPSGSRFDFGGSLTFTPAHFALNRKIKLAPTLLGGYQTLPNVGFESDRYFGFQPAIQHQGHPFAGTRLSFDLSDPLRLELNFRRVFGRNHNLAGATLAYLF